MNLMTNSGSKIVYELGNITGAVETKFHPEMIVNVQILH